MSTPTDSWYIVQQADGRCEIQPELLPSTSDSAQTWGPFTSKGEAIARRVGLIRAGKCQPS